jgi:hypothetical protein
VNRGVVVNGMKERVVNVTACCTGLSDAMDNRVRASFVFALALAFCRRAGDAGVRRSGYEEVTASLTSRSLLIRRICV